MLDSIKVRLSITVRPISYRKHTFGYDAGCIHEDTLVYSSTVCQHFFVLSFCDYPYCIIVSPFLPDPWQKPEFNGASIALYGQAASEDAYWKNQMDDSGLRTARVRNKE